MTKATEREIELWQKKTKLLADAFYTELELIDKKNTGISRNSKTFLILANEKKIEAKSMLENMIEQRIKAGVLKGEHLICHISYFLLDVISAQLEQGIKAATDKDFQRNNIKTMEEALNKIIQHEYEVRGL